MLNALTRSPDDWHQTTPVPVKHAPMAHHRMGLLWNPTGYGARIPSRYMVQMSGRWRRVYYYCYSNACTMYIGRSIKAGSIVDIWET